MSTALSPPAIPNGLAAGLLAWYGRNARDLPWRHTADAYAILVAEVMLQQTQVERVVPKYGQFLAAFPTLEALAAAALGDVIRAWAPLGYNGRAVRLHRLAQLVVQEYGGRLPCTMGELLRLPGLGPYSAAAVACFAFGAAVPVLDTNVYRVLSRVAWGMTPPPKRAIVELDRQWLPPEHASAWHQALMDVGATLCTVARPGCLLCPLRPHCLAAPHLQDGASRRLAESSVPYAPKQPQFADSPRYYRGRVVDALRRLPAGSSVGLAELGRTVRPGFDPEQHTKWLRELLAGLEKDGLVLLSADANGTVRVSLP